MLQIADEKAVASANTVFNVVKQTGKKDKDAVQRARRRTRKTSGTAAVDDQYERLRSHILSASTDENPLQGATLYCDPETPQWFALKVPILALALLSD